MKYFTSDGGHFTPCTDLAAVNLTAATNMLTSRPAPLTASRPLHVKTPGKALQKARGILQENALQGPRTIKTQKVQLQLQSPHEGGSPSTDCHLLLNSYLIKR